MELDFPEGQCSVVCGSWAARTGPASICVAQTRGKAERDDQQRAQARTRENCTGCHSQSLRLQHLPCMVSCKVNVKIFYIYIKNYEHKLLYG